MAESALSVPIYPGKGLGFLTLGASLHGILTWLKAQPHKYPSIDVSYSPSVPLLSPVILTLPHNGIRLRFDGPDQRLRLIEVLDFTKIHLVYKSTDIIKPDVRPADRMQSSPTGPSFRHVYHRLIGPTFPGEYIPNVSGIGAEEGTYILSYPGIAFSFPLRDSAWSPKLDFVSLLSSSAASAAKSLAIFIGSSWQEARGDLFTRPPLNPRSLAFAGRGKETGPDEIEVVKIRGNGQIDMIRRSSPPFHMILSQTTPQDLVAELGPPDAIYRKHDRRLSIHQTRSKDYGQLSRRRSSAGHDDLIDNDHLSTKTTTDDSDIDNDLGSSSQSQGDLSAECFFNYFHHGFDVLISYPTRPSQGFPGTGDDGCDEYSGPLNDRVVATKLLLHANVPGSYSFNRYRRSRWVIDHKQIPACEIELNSETSFTELSNQLKRIWKSNYPSDMDEASMQRGMVLNRGWGDSPGSSCELLGGWEEGTDGKDNGSKANGNNSGPNFGNTELFGFPGLVFEVLKNDAVSCLTIF